MENHLICFQSNPKAANSENCAQCRWRKVRCDKARGQSGGCGSCERLSLDCSFRNRSGHEVKPSRLRGHRACIACREKKIRCSATSPQCQNCKRRGQICTYPKPKRVPQTESPRSEASPDDVHIHDTVDIVDTDTMDTVTNASIDAAASPTSPSPPVTESMLALVDAFFENLYPLPSYAFLHPQITRRRCRDGKMHRALASAICGLTSHHLQRDHALGHKWIQAAEQSVWMHLECPTIPRLQTLLLVIYHRVETGQLQRAFMLTAMAARFASAMHLNYERPDLDRIAREVRRRIVWSLKIVERYFCHGLSEFELIPIEAIYLDFPSSEEDFDTARPGDHGAYCIHVRLEIVRRDIIKLTRGLSPLEEPLPSIMELIQHHALTLSEIESCMQPEIQSVSGLVTDPWLSRRLSMKVSWHQSHCDLNRLLLPGYPEAAPSVVLDAIEPSHLAEAETQCLLHAMSIIQILTTLNQESTSSHILEFDTAICAYHATRLLLYISRFGKQPNRPTPEFALSRADLCLAALKRFFSTSVLVAPMVEELQNSIGLFSQQQKTGEVSAPKKARQSGGLAKTTQKLAVHSLLRQAEFSEDDDVSVDLVSAEEMSQYLPERQKSPLVESGGYLNTPSTHVGSDSTSMYMDLERFGDMESSLILWGGPADWDWLSVRG